MRFEGAACFGADPRLFFPEQGQSSKPGKRICAGCPAKQECLDYAVTYHNSQTDFGIWGGTSHRERMVLRRGAA